MDAQIKKTRTKPLKSVRPSSHKRLLGIFTDDLRLNKDMQSIQNRALILLLWLSLPFVAYKGRTTTVTSLLSTCLDLTHQPESIYQVNKSMSEELIEVRSSEHLQLGSSRYTYRVAVLRRGVVKLCTST